MNNNLNMMNRISEILMRSYSISVISLSETQAGWSALAYKITGKQNNYFLKVYDKHRYTSQSWIRGIDEYMPIVYQFLGKPV